MKRWLLPIAAAAAVLLLLGGVWYFAGPGSRGNDSSFAGGDTGTGEPDSGGFGGGVVGSPGGVDDDPADGGDPGDGGQGSTKPGFPGTADPGIAPGPDEPVPAPTDPMAVRVDSYYRYDGRHLALSYTIGVPECYGEIATPQVEETSRVVTVTLTRVPPKPDGDVACIEIALLKSVDIELDQPLGDRELRDGSVPDSLVRPGPPPGAEPADLG